MGVTSCSEEGQCPRQEPSIAGESLETEVRDSASKGGMPDSKLPRADSDKSLANLCHVVSVRFYITCPPGRRMYMPSWSCME